MTLLWPADEQELLSQCRLVDCGKPTVWVFDGGGYGMLNLCADHGSESGYSEPAGSKPNQPPEHPE